MGYVRKFIGGMDAMVDEQTGAILVAGTFTAMLDPTGLATSAKQEAGNASLTAIRSNTDKLPTDPATESGKLADIASRLASVLEKLSDDPATDGALDDIADLIRLLTGAGSEYADLPDVVAALAKVANIPTDPATESGKLADIAAQLLDGENSAAKLLADVLAAIQALTPAAAPVVQLGRAEVVCAAISASIELATVGVGLTELRVTCTAGDAELTFTDSDADPDPTGERILANSGPIRIPVPTSALFLHYISYGDPGAVLKMNFLAGAQPPPE